MKLKKNQIKSEIYTFASGTYVKYYFIESEGNYFYINGIVPGLLHRENGPAVESTSWFFNNLYYKYGKLHREDGPAIDYNNHRLDIYVLNGVEQSRGVDMRTEYLDISTFDLQYSQKDIERFRKLGKIP